MPFFLGALIPAFLESCPGLSSDQKQELVAKYAYVVENEMKEVAKETEEDASGNANSLQSPQELKGNSKFWYFA